MLKIALKNIKKVNYGPKTILDVGAHKGNWTREVLKIFPTAKYELVEATDYPDLHRFDSDSRVNYTIALVADEAKEIKWCSIEGTGDSVFKESTSFYSSVEPVMKQATTLDTLFEGQSFDFIKLDVQGAELMVLRGSQNLVKNANFILMELPFMGQYNEGAPTFLDYIKYMDSVGFIPYDLTEVHKGGFITVQIDILFINKNCKLNELVQNIINNAYKS